MLKSYRKFAMASVATAMAVGISGGNAQADIDGSISVTAAVPADVLTCTLGTIGSIGFGNIDASIAAAGIEQTTTIAFTCTSDTTITVEMLGDVNRVMSNGTGSPNEDIDYLINQPDLVNGGNSGVPWGTNSSLDVAVSSGVEKTLDVFANIVGSQDADPGTSYSDTTTVRVNF